MRAQKHFLTKKNPPLTPSPSLSLYISQWEFPSEQFVFHRSIIYVCVTENRLLNLSYFTCSDQRIIYCSQILYARTRPPLRRWLSVLLSTLAHAWNAPKKLRRMYATSRTRPNTNVCPHFGIIRSISRIFNRKTDRSDFRLITVSFSSLAACLAYIGCIHLWRKNTYRIYIYI